MPEIYLGLARRRRSVGLREHDESLRSPTGHVPRASQRRRARTAGNMPPADIGRSGGGAEWYHSSRHGTHTVQARDVAQKCSRMCVCTPRDARTRLGSVRGSGMRRRRGHTPHRRAPSCRNTAARCRSEAHPGARRTAHRGERGPLRSSTTGAIRSAPFSSAETHQFNRAPHPPTDDSARSPSRPTVRRHSERRHPRCANAAPRRLGCTCAPDLGGADARCGRAGGRAALVGECTIVRCVEACGRSGSRAEVGWALYGRGVSDIARGCSPVGLANTAAGSSHRGPCADGVPGTRGEETACTCLCEMACAAASRTPASSMPRSACAGGLDRDVFAGRPGMAMKRMLGSRTGMYALARAHEARPAIATAHSAWSLRLSSIAPPCCLSLQE